MININSYKNDIINAYVEVYGEEYRPRIYSYPLTLDSVDVLPVFHFDGREIDKETLASKEELCPVLEYR